LRREKKKKRVHNFFKNKNKKLLVIFLVANFRHIVKNVLEKKILSQIPCFLGKNLVEKSKILFLKLPLITTIAYNNESVL
jgi:hypothetical protein